MKRVTSRDYQSIGKFWNADEFLIWSWWNSTWRMEIQSIFTRCEDEMESDVRHYENTSEHISGKISKRYVVTKSSTRSISFFKESWKHWNPVKCKIWRHYFDWRVWRHWSQAKNWCQTSRWFGDDVSIGNPYFVLLAMRSIINALQIADASVVHFMHTESDELVKTEDLTSCSSTTGQWRFEHSLISARRANQWTEHFAKLSPKSVTIKETHNPALIRRNVCNNDGWWEEW